MQKLSELTGYSVDRRGLYNQGLPLGLYDTDPYQRPLQPKDGCHTGADLAALFPQLFPAGLSPHGWQQLTQQFGFLHGNVPGAENFVHYETQLELVLELVRRLEFQGMPSRLQSYFAWEALAEAEHFRQPGQSIFRVRSERAARLDQRWLALGVQGIASWFNARRYWSGEATSQPAWELVMSAPATVLEQIN